MARRLAARGLFTFVIAFSAFAFGVFAPPLAAQEAPAAQPITVEGLASLVETLEDEARRARLVTDLKALIEARQAIEAEGTHRVSDDFGFVGQRMRALSNQFLSVTLALGDLPNLVDWLKRQVADADARALWFGLLFKLAVILAASLLAEQGGKVLIARPVRAIESRDGAGVAVRFLLLLVRAALQIMPLALFLAVAYAAMPLVQAEDRVRIVAVAVINAYAVVRAIMIVVHALFATRAEALRIFPLSGETAHYLVIWVRRFSVLSVFGYYLAGALPLFGMTAEGHAVLLRLLGLMLTAMVVIFLLQNRMPVARAIRSFGGADLQGGLRLLRDRLADVWHVLAILYAVAIFIVGALAVEGGFRFMLQATLATGLILLLARLTGGALHRVLDRGFAIGAETRQRYPGLETRANRYLPFLHMVVRAVIWLLAGLALLQVWGVDALRWFETPFGQKLLASTFSITIVLVLALLFWELVNSAFERYLSQTDQNGNTVSRSARARTLLPLLRNVIFILLVAVIGLIVLSELGVNIAPLLAGAGVIGLALGFGSQKLVQDVITGAFILFEDSISVGDVANVGGQAGLVEGITIRSIRLRDLEGKVHTIPFSAVGTVTNLTKEFSFYVLNVSVAYREDTDHVIEVLKEIGADLQAAPEFGCNMLGPIEVLGVDSFADSAVIIKARLKTLPLKQWAVGREFNRRMKKRFDELGIEIPFPHLTLYQGQNKTGKAPPLFVAGEVAVRQPAAQPGDDGLGLAGSGAQPVKD